MLFLPMDHSLPARAMAPSPLLILPMLQLNPLLEGIQSLLLLLLLALMTNSFLVRVTVAKLGFGISLLLNACVLGR